MVSTISIIILLCFFVGCTAPSGPDVLPQKENTSIIVKDALGNTVILQHPAQRIISTSTCAVEMLVILGAGDKIAGVTDNQYTVDTIVNGHLPNAEPIGGFSTPAIDKIITLKPDLMIVYPGRSQPGNVDQITNSGISLIYVNTCLPSQINRDIQMLGNVTGTEENATRYIEFSDYYLNLVDSRISSGNITPPRVYIEGQTPYLTQGNGTAGDELIALLHGENIANLTGTPVVSKEWVTSSNPDIIVKSVGTEWHPVLADYYQEVKGRSDLSGITAIEHNRVYVYNSVQTSRPRYVITLLYLAKQFYPDLFTDIDPDKVRQEYAMKFLPGSDETEIREFERYYPPLP